MGIILAFAFNDEKSFDNIELWIEQIRQHAHEGVSILLIGNKSDIKEAEKQVTDAQAEELAKKHGLSMIITSAKTGKNVQ